MMRFYKLVLFLVIPLLLLVPAVVAQDAKSDGETKALRTDKIALKAGRIITVADEEIVNGTILIDNGRIVDLGKDLKIPYDYWVVDAGDMVVFPGFVEAHTSRGIDRSNESMPVVPYLSVFDAIDPSSLHFEEALRAGITTLLISQAHNTAIGGMARVVRPIGMTTDEMTIKAEAGLKLSFTPMSGQDRLTQMALFRETFRELEEYTGDLAEKKYEEDLEEKDEKIKVAPADAREKGKALLKDEDFDFKHLNLKKLVEGRLAAHVYCGAAMDVHNAIAVAKKNGFLKRTIFVLGNDCWKAAAAIKATGRPVVLGPSMIHREEDPLTGEETETFVPLAFYEAGVPFAILTDTRGVYGTNYPWYQAARLVRNGIPRDEALKAITIQPASFIGVGNRLGVILPGYEATFLVLTGDPLDNRTWVDKVYIEGKAVYDREKDYRLEELLAGDKEARVEAEEAEKAPAEEVPADKAEGSGKETAPVSKEKRADKTPADKTPAEKK